MSKLVTTQDLQNYATTITLTDALAQQVVDAVNAFVENATHRVWGEVKTFTERADYGQIMYLDKQDVTGVTSIKLGYPGKTPSTLTLNTDYWWDAWGRVTLLSMYNYPYGTPTNYVEIVYTSGVTVVPSDLKLAALAIAYDMYQDALSGGKSVSEVNVGSYRVTYNNRTPGPNGIDESTKSSFDVIERYKQRRV